ncbi:putative beta-lactamase HcpD [alpha proteobacterium Q-1]|nr:putative beta-lactamase HcpD [alpha proteobacterium Q-1]
MTRICALFGLWFICFSGAVFAQTEADTLGKSGIETGSASGPEKAEEFLAMGTALLARGEDGDWAKALPWLEKAAQKGAPVTLLIADLYHQGVGVEQNLEKAAFWFHISAETGNALAQYELGRLYLDGRGVEKDAVQAVLYLQLAHDGLRDPQRLKEAEAALTRAKLGAGWDEWQRVKRLLSTWQPKSLSELLN